MKLIIDEAIPFINGVFEPYGEVVYKEGADICREDLDDVDALVIRTRTKCTGSLLEGTPVKLIATATIGTDHIDMAYCSKAGIYVQSASGCNVGGVSNYVFSALYGIAARRGVDLKGMTFGIIGAGHVGGMVEGTARYLGFNVLLNDPPRAEAEGPGQFCDLDYLLANSDIVSMHVPLSESTRGMANEEFFAKMKKGACFINTCRGEVVVDEALIAARPKLGAIVIDTWNREPDVNIRLLNIVDIATPHIAGYSYQGKQKGTAMAVRAVAHFFGIKELYEFYPKTELTELNAVHLDFSGKSQGEIAAAIQYNYPIFTDDFMFRTNPSGFEKLRTEYSYRREFIIE